MTFSVDGILLFDKPIGMSSHFALQKVKRLLKAAKAGHTGSLDPQATGMLPLCFGEATKFSRFILEADKCYDVVIHLGVTTTTGDSEGSILETRTPPAITEKIHQDLVAQFEGAQLQIPPMFSAIKHQGQPLYKMARQGKTIERTPRPIHIHHLSFSSKMKSNRLCCRVICSKGTYIRTLAEDMGAYLGCGAHVTTLRRVWAAPFESYPMITLSQLEELSPDEYLKPFLSLDKVLSSLLPRIELSEEEAFLLKRGQRVWSEGNKPKEAAKGMGWVALIAPEKGFLGVGEMLEDGSIAPRRLLQQTQIC